MNRTRRWRTVAAGFTKKSQGALPRLTRKEAQELEWKHRQEPETLKRKLERGIDTADAKRRRYPDRK